MSELRPLSRPLGYLSYKVTSWYDASNSSILRFLHRFLRRATDWVTDLENVVWYRYNVIKVRSLGPGWCDKVELIPEFLFQQLVDYVEQEDCFNVIVWDSDPKHIEDGAEIKFIYNWIKETYPAEQKALEKKYDGKRAENLEHMKTLMCHRIICLRRTLWT